MVAVRSGAITYDSMAGVGIPPREIITHLEMCMRAKPPKPVILLGPPGLGKSKLVEYAARRACRALKVTRSYYYNPVDWRGAPIGDMEAKVTRYFPPDFLPLDELTKDCPPMVWFFDDCNVVPTSVQAVLYEVLLERTVCGKKISDNVVFVAAANRAEDRALTHEMSSALQTRFVRLTMRPDVDDWMAWATSAGVAVEVRTFIKACGTKHLYNLDMATDSTRTPRTWEYVSDLVLAGAAVEQSNTPLFSGCVGRGGATEFVNHWKLYKDLPDPNKIVVDGDFSANSPGSETPDRVYVFSGMLAAAVMRAPEAKRVQAAKNHIAYVTSKFPGNEFAVQAYKELTRSREYSTVHEPLLMSKEFLVFAKRVKDLLDVA